MAWIESHQELRGHPKVYDLMSKLSIDKPQALGHLHLFWWWCVDYAPTGRLQGFNDLQIARAAEWSGEPKMFVAALIESRLLDRSGGVLTVHDWIDFCGELIKKRLERQSGKRQKLAEIGRNCLPTVPNRTVPNPTKPRTSSFRLPPNEAIKLSHLLRDLTIRNGAIGPTAARVQAWSRDADLLLRVDKRDPDEAEAVLRWCQADSFWKANILSMGKFRKQYDQLKLKMRGENENLARNTGRSEGSYAGGNASGSGGQGAGNPYANKLR